ncbi:MAG: EF-hand domain-containing protein [Spartobacteria bacterium]
MKKTSTFLTSFGIGLAILSTGLVHAAEPPKETPTDDSKIAKRFEKLDADKNGSISLDEFKANAKNPANAEKKFGKLDTDNNGSLSLAEFSAGATPKPPKGDQ